MGSRRRPQPALMPAKLLRIRQSLGLSQEQMARRLESPLSPVYPTHVSEFERGLREPSLIVLLAYAEAANVWVEALIKDSVDLPDELPSRTKHEGVRRKPQRRAAQAKED